MRGDRERENERDHSPPAAAGFLVVAPSDVEDFLASPADLPGGGGISSSVRHK